MENKNGNNTREYSSEDEMSVEGDETKEINKDDASHLPKLRICFVIFISAYIVSLSSFIQMNIIFKEGLTVNKETIITGAIGLVLQFVGLIMSQCFDYKIFQYNYCISGAKLRLITISEFILSIIELLFVILLQPNAIEEYSRLYYVLFLPFILITALSGMLYIIMIVSSIHFLVTVCST
jgi:hypothetical protein